MFTSKFPEMGTTIFSEMSQLANTVGAVNLSQGFPDYSPDPILFECVAQAMKSGYNQYAPMPGMPALRNAVAEKYTQVFLKQHGNSTDVIPPNADTEITITPGGTVALYTAIATVVKPGDEVIIFSPAYDSYGPAVIANGGVPVYAHLLFPNYMPDWDEVHALTTSRTVLIIINTPHNPTGTVWDAAQYTALEEYCNKHNVNVLSDEVYELITFDGVRHISVLSIPGLRHRAFVVTSFGKTFHITGWKIGVCIAPSHLTAEFRKVHQFLTFSVNTPMQVGLANYMLNAETYLGLSEFFQRKRDYFRGLIGSTRFTVLPCKGTYFQLLGYANVSDETDVNFAKRLTTEHGVAAIPLSPFIPGNVSQPVLRFCFAKENSTLELAAEKLARV
ncbi:MAG: aminotransferase class I/II-fold pyridoxal phosphate-dependent enzyme [Ignavibacteria bacterium]|nr:aminotransferase class I/II-fold pyridoxal phosphate-dependent enzyme [Ignavibacteria bacterium]